jgi:hypothetical protein
MFERSREILAHLALTIAVVSGCGDDEDGDETNAAVESCRQVCDAIEEEGCLEVTYPTLDACLDNCDDVLELSTGCQEASRALDECRLSRTTLCDDIDATEDCAEELDSVVDCD